MPQQKPPTPLYGVSPAHTDSVKMLHEVWEYGSEGLWALGEQGGVGWGGVGWGGVGGWYDASVGPGLGWDMASTGGQGSHSRGPFLLDTTGTNWVGGGMQ